MGAGAIPHRQVSAADDAVVDIRGDATLKTACSTASWRSPRPSFARSRAAPSTSPTTAIAAMRLGIDLLKPPALFPNMTGQERAHGVDARRALRDRRLFLPADFRLRAVRQYRLRRPACRGTRAAVAMADARADPAVGARRSPASATSPARCSPTRSIEGWLTITPKLVRGDGLKLTSAKWNGKISLLIDLVTGRFEVTAVGRDAALPDPRLGIVDVITDLKVVPGPNSKGSHVVGTAKAWVRRLDNSFFRDLTGGLPSLTTNLERGNDGIVHFTNLQIYSPKLRLSGAGQRFKDGTFHIVAAGRQAKYGPLKMVLDGHIERPTARPAARPPERRARHHAAMHLLLMPTAAGFDYRASGGSRLGPFTSNGQILLPHNAPTVIAIAALDAGGAHASGSLRSDPGGFSGRLMLANGTLGGTLDFAPVSGKPADRRASHRQQRQLPRRVRGSQRPRRRHHHPRRRPHDDRRSRSMRAAFPPARCRSRGSPPTPSWSTARGQVRAAFAGRRGAAFAFSTARRHYARHASG